MNWKLFITACSSTACLLFPYNIIGCSGGEMDPYDYYVSFYHKDLAGDTSYRPFYYTNYQFLYDPVEPVNVAEITSAEWAGFGENRFSAREAYDFICRFSFKDISVLYYHLEKKQPLGIPDSVQANGMTKFFLQQKNLEALGYILYAQQVEPYVTGSWNSWEVVERDVVVMDKLIKNGQQLWKAAKSDFIKLRYAYQLVRLAHYNKRYADCIQWYTDLVKTNGTKSVLQELSLGLKAGAEFRMGNKFSAAYTFSGLFANGRVKKVANYMSFDWCIRRFDESNRKKCLSYCKNPIEQANMLALFALGSNKNEFKLISQVYSLAPQSAVLPLLITREVNKLEEFFFTPSIEFRQGKEKVYVGYTEVSETSKEYKAWQQECIQLIDFCKKAAGGASVQKSFCLLSAAHLAMISGNTQAARELLDQVKKEKLNALQTDQWFITNLLLTINAQQRFDQKFENDLMRSVQWLEQKAKTDIEFAKFYRRLFADILASKYKSNKDKNSYKYILCKGVADKIHTEYEKDNWGYYAQSLQLLRNEVPAQQVEELNQLLESKKMNEFEKFLVSNSAFTRNDVNDVAGTAWLRQYNFSEAAKWFKKIPVSYYQDEPYKTFLAANPFADIIPDTHAATEQDTVKYTKFTFTQKMMQLEKQVMLTSDKEKKAILLYELAKGYYQMSYWGNSWLLTEYSWSGSESEYGLTGRPYPKKTNPDYYEVNKAKTCYLDALSNTTNKNLQARCIFMAAKCDQKFVGKIPWDKAEIRGWVQAFDKKNSFFTQLKNNFNTTSFYKEAFTTCSYLRDFVQQK